MTLTCQTAIEYVRTLYTEAAPIKCAVLGSEHGDDTVEVHMLDGSPSWIVWALADGSLYGES